MSDLPDVPCGSSSSEEETPGLDATFKLPETSADSKPTMPEELERTDTEEAPQTEGPISTQLGKVTVTPETEMPQETQELSDPKPPVEPVEPVKAQGEPRPQPSQRPRRPRPTRRFVEGHEGYEGHGGHEGHEGHGQQGPVTQPVTQPVTPPVAQPVTEAPAPPKDPWDSGCSWPSDPSSSKARACLIVELSDVSFRPFHP